MASYDFEHTTERDLEHFRQADEYTLRHLAVHLHESGQNEKLYRLLIGNRAWMEAKFESLAGDAEYAAELELAIEGLEDPLTTEDMLTLAQLYTAVQVVTARASIYEDFHLAALISLDRVPEALSQARLRSDPKGRFDGLIAIYEAQKQGGLSDPALLGEAEQAARNIGSDIERVGALSTLGEVLAKAEDSRASEVLEEALKLAQTVGAADALQVVAEALARTGKAEDAILVAQSIDDAQRRVEALSRVSVALAQEGEIANALRVARGLESDPLRAATLNAVAAALDRFGDDVAEGVREKIFEEALDAAYDAYNAYGDGETLLELVVALAQAGEIGEALDTARSLEVRPVQELVKMALALKDRRPPMADYLLGEALELARALSDDEALKVDELWAVGEALALAGDKRASEVLTEASEKAWSEEERAMMLSKASAALAQAAQINQALRMAHSIEKPSPYSIDDEAIYSHYRKEALSAVATAMARVGDRRTSTLLKEVLEISRSIEPIRERADTLAEMAVALAHAGEVAKALEAVGDLPIVHYRGNRHPDSSKEIDTLCRVAEVLFRKRDRQADMVLEKARKRARSTVNEQQKIDGLEKVALTLAGAGRVEEAVAEAASIDDDFHRPYVLSHVASVLVQDHPARASRVFDSALHATRQWVQDDSYELMRLERFTSEVLTDKVKALIKTGAVGNAWGVAGSIEDPVKRSEALSAVAIALDQAGDTRANEALQNALEVALSLKREESRGLALCLVAVTLAGAGRLNEALEISDSIKEPQSSALRRIAKGLAQAGGFSEALDVARSISDPVSREAALYIVATTLAQAGHTEYAREVTDTIEDTEQRGRALTTVAKALAQSGQFKQAFATLGPHGLTEFLQILATWAPVFEQVKQGLSVAVLYSATRIIGWERPRWRKTGQSLFVCERPKPPIQPWGRLIGLLKPRTKKGISAG